MRGNRGQAKMVPATPLFIHEARGMAQLVKTGEVRCVVQALDELYDVILKNPAIGQDLIGRGIVQNVLNIPYSAYPYYNGVRYRFLAKMYTLFPETRAEMEPRTEFLEMAAKDALTTSDTPLRAYALQYVALLTQDSPEILERLFSAKDLNDPFLHFLVDPDIDVQNNALGVLKNLLTIKNIKKKITMLRNFRFTSLCALAACPYPDIQNKALDILDVLLSDPKKRKWNHDLFVQADGVDVLMKLLFVFQWRDIHIKCLRNLGHLILNDDAILVAFQNVLALEKLVQYIDFIEDDELQQHCLWVINKILNILEGRLLLLQYKLLPVVNGLLKNRSEPTTFTALECMVLLSTNPTDITELSANDPVKLVLDILCNNENSYHLRSIAAKALQSLATNVPQCALSLSKKDNLLILRKNLFDFHKGDKSFVVEVLNMVEAILTIPTRFDYLIDEKFIRMLLYLIYFYFNTDLDIACFAVGTLTHAIKQIRGRKAFMDNLGVTEIIKILFRAGKNCLIDRIGLLLTEAFTHRKLARAFQLAGVTSWFYHSRDKWKDCNSMHVAIHKLLDFDLSVKFLLGGRLEDTDITTDGFHIVRAPVDKDVEIEVLTSETTSYRPVYYVYLGLDGEPDPSTDELVCLIDIDVLGGDLDLEESLELLERRSTRQSVVEVEKPEFPFLVDTRLRELISAVQEEIEEGKVEDEERDLELRRMVRVIGEVVNKAMSGGDEETSARDCSDHSFELHLKELSCQLGTWIMPIGRLRVGLKLERAMLFKAIADRVSCPVSLVRGSGVTAWVEVDLPCHADPTCRRVFDTFVVDLMDDPGRLMPWHSALAQAYCGPHFEPHLPLNIVRGKTYGVPDPEFTPKSTHDK